jgi:two-component sensor histidine kinase
MTRSRADEHVLSLPLTAQAPRAARRWVSEDELVPPEIRARTVLLVSELVANSVVHSGLPPTERVDLSLAATPDGDGVRVTVSDPGAGIGSRERAGGNSFGLRLVERLADRWGHQDAPSRVWFEITSAPANDEPV